MDVHADGGFVEPQRNNKVRGLAPDPGQLAQRLDGLRQAPPEFFVKDIGQRFQVTRLVAVKADRVDETLQFLLRDVAQVVGCRDALEEPSARRRRASVFCPRAENGAEQDAERVPRLRGDQIHDRGPHAVEGFFEQTVDGGDVGGGHNG